MCQILNEIAVLGSGSWGTSLAMVLTDNGYRVRLWARRDDQANEINTQHTNEKYLKNIILSDQIVAYSDITHAIKNISILVLVTPTKSIREVLSQIKPSLEAPVMIIHASKGIEPHTSKRISEMIEEEIPSEKLSGVVVLSGPSHAEEVCLRHPTTVTVSSKNIDLAHKAQDIFINANFRVYTNPDIIGVELGGALKNIIALGAGISDGLGYGDNAKAALITRGLAEITRLGTKMGANPLTFLGLAGIGDLIVTCTSVHSRNWRCGNLIGKGYDVDSAVNQMGMVVEGVRTTEAAYFLAKRENVELPITNVLYEVLYHHKTPKDAVDELMTRSRTNEIDDISLLLEGQINGKD